MRLYFCVVPVKYGQVNSLEKVYPYNAKFCKDIIQAALIQRENRLKEINKTDG
jgi:hypothetical protein